ncbi:MAG: ribonuclease E/G [Lachnospiraceae bacterium]
METPNIGKFIITTCTRGQVTVTVACFICDGVLEYIKVFPVDNSFFVGTIVTAKVKQVVPSIPAAFVALDVNTMAFLPTSRMQAPVLTNRCFSGKLSSGDELLVQVSKEAVKTKDAVVSDEISLQGRYCVIKNGTGCVHFSKQLSQKERRNVLLMLQKRAICTSEKQLIGIELEGVTVTIRTNARDVVDDKILAKDIEQTIVRYLELIRKAKMRTCYTIHHRQIENLNMCVAQVRRTGVIVEEVITDIGSVKEQIPEARFYCDDSVSLSMLYGLSTKIDELLTKRVWLDCGGYLIIEATEAMTVIDVNSGKATGFKNTQELIKQVNLEAAIEVTRQLRLRNISGIVIVDFINYEKEVKEKCELEILEIMEEKSALDETKVTCHGFTKLGLLEMTRDKKYKPLHEIIR